jgi:hypothetical protein
MGRYEYALTSLPNHTMTKIAGPVYVLADHFSTSYKKRTIKADGLYGLTRYRNTRYFASSLQLKILQETRSSLVIWRKQFRRPPVEEHAIIAVSSLSRRSACSSDRSGIMTPIWGGDSRLATYRLRESQWRAGRSAPLRSPKQDNRRAVFLRSGTSVS